MFHDEQYSQEELQKIHDGDTDYYGRPAAPRLTGKQDLVLMLQVMAIVVVLLLAFSLFPHV